MEVTAGSRDQRSGRGRRVAAVISSLIQPGAGHVLLGRFRRGIAWAIGMVGARLIGLLMPISFATILLALAVLIAGSVACALDTMRLGARRSRWVVVLAGWVGLLVVGSAFGRTAEGFYKDRYAQAFTIPSGSMRDTLLVGDHVLVDKSAYRTGSPRRGDVVVFRYPPDERRHFIHRIVGMPGDTLQLRGPQVLINGKLLDEPYVRSRPPARGQTGPTACPYPHGCEALVIPPDAYFVMGDDRDNSQDSRYWGFVKREKITGRAFVIYWSWDGDRHRLRPSRLGRPIS